MFVKHACLLLECLALCGTCFLVILVFLTRGVFRCILLRLLIKGLFGSTEGGEVTISLFRSQGEGGGE
jgi:hypothetical protein